MGAYTEKLRKRAQTKRLAAKMPLSSDIRW